MDYVRFFVEALFATVLYYVLLRKIIEDIMGDIKVSVEDVKRIVVMLAVSMGMLTAFGLELFYPVTYIIFAIFFLAVVLILAGSSIVIFIYNFLITLNKILIKLYDISIEKSRILIEKIKIEIEVLRARKQAELYKEGSKGYKQAKSDLEQLEMIIQNEFRRVSTILDSALRQRSYTEDDIRSAVDSLNYFLQYAKSKLDSYEHLLEDDYRYVHDLGRQISDLRSWINSKAAELNSRIHVVWRRRRFDPPEPYIYTI